MGSTLVPPRACSPRTQATASVSPATSRAAISPPSGRDRAGSRMPNVIAGAASRWTTTRRLPIPAALSGLDLAPRHLALLAYLHYDGPLTVSELAGRLEAAPTTVSLMVGDLSRRGILTRQERATIVATMSAYEAALDRHARPDLSPEAEDGECPRLR